jgi:hypothetical protein
LALCHFDKCRADASLALQWDYSNLKAAHRLAAALSQLGSQQEAAIVCARVAAFADKYGWV